MNDKFLNAKIMAPLALACMLLSCDQSKQPDQAVETEEQADFTRLAGSATVFDETPLAYSREVAKLGLEHSRAFNRGRAFFRDVWVTAPATTSSRDGLGPVFNARSCEACHVEDGRGRPPLEDESVFTSMLIRLSIPGRSETGGPLPLPDYGDQIQNFAIPGVPIEGQPKVRYQSQAGSFADGTPYELLVPSYTIEDLNFGALPDDTRMSPRVAPAMIGLGLLEAIPAEEILALADPEDLDGDGISGKANMVWSVEAGSPQLGRFGWKANQPTLKQQVAGAFRGDIGISSRLFPSENCPALQSDCAASPHGGEPELLDTILDDVVLYSAALAVPAQRRSQDPDVRRGQQLFHEAGCESCHRSTWVTGDSEHSPILSQQTIHPFTDLLLHDMGEALADQREDFLANGNEWRTPPLWGLGLLEKVNGHMRLLHDGRARSISEAILWHGGEGENAKQRFLQFSESERQALLRFLESL